LEVIQTEAPVDLAGRGRQKDLETGRLGAGGRKPRLDAGEVGWWRVLRERSPSQPLEEGRLDGATEVGPIQRDLEQRFAARTDEFEDEAVVGGGCGHWRAP